MINNTENNPLGLDIYFPFLDFQKASLLVARYGEIVISGFADNYTNIVLRLYEGEKREEIRNCLLPHCAAILNFPHDKEDKIKLYKFQTNIDLSSLLEKLEQIETIEQLKTICEQYPSKQIDECWLLFDDDTRKRLNPLANTLFG